MITNKPVNIHYDTDGVQRDFHRSAFTVFFKKYPQYKKYILPTKEMKGWDFAKQLKQGPETEKIAKLMEDEIFGNDEMCYKIFHEAKSFISPDEWKRHIDKILAIIPNANITISTHQFVDSARLATIQWYSEHKYTDGDNISILFTGKKTEYNAHFLLDDKPATIEKFHKPNKSIGVLRINPHSNTWYLKQKNYKLDFPYAKNLEDYYLIIKKNVRKLDL